ncbi:MAG: hypothetical protein ABXS91_05960 [Sulfurimonas sp.]
MQKKIKESVATLLAHIIKLDERDIEKEAPLFCDILGQDFECSEAESKAFLKDIMEKEYDLDQHIQIIKQALCEDRISKYHLMEQLNHIIYSDKITPEDYAFFEKLKNELFESD